MPNLDPASSSMSTLPDSYYFQEDSSEESSVSLGERTPPAIPNTSHPRGGTQPTRHSQTNRSPTHRSSTTSPSTSTATTTTTTAKAKNSPVLPKTTKGNSPTQTPPAEPLPAAKDTPRVEHQLKDDSKSLAIMIEDSQLLSRSDLEESLLKNLFSSVKNLESDVSVSE